MIHRLKKLLAETSVYTAGNLFLRSFSIITMPVFTRFMSTSQYGVLAVVRTVRDLFTVVYEAGTSAASMRMYYDCDTFRQEQRLFSSLFFFTSGLGLVMSLALALAGARLWPLVIKDIPFVPFGLLTVFTVFMMTAGILPRTIFRAKGLAKRFVLLNFLQALLIVTISIVLVVVYRMEALGPVIAAFAVSIAFSAVYIRYLKPYLSLAFSWRIVRQALSFGLPESPVRFGNWALRMANQIILQYYVPLSIVGMYSVGYAVGSIVFELTMSGVHSAILPFYYQTAKEESPEQARRIFAYVGVYNLVLVLFLSMFTIFMGEPLLLLFASAKYAEALPVVMVIAASCVFQFLFFIPSRGLYIMKKTMVFPPLLFITVAVNVTLSFLLIPRFGMLGAAWATLAAFALRSVLTFAVSQRVYPVPYDYGKAAKAVLAFLVLVLAGTHLPQWPLIALLPIRCALLAMFPLLLRFFGFYEKEEWEHIRSHGISLYRKLLSPAAAGVSSR